MTKRLLSDTDPCADEGCGCGCANERPKKARKEGTLLPDSDENEGMTSDETWTPSSDDSGDESGEEAAVEPLPPPVRTLRSKGPVVRPGDEMHAVMDKIDEVIDNESDFSSSTEEEEEDDEESEDDGEEEEEDEESDTEEDGYSDDDSFVTSGEEDEEEEDDDEPTVVGTPNAPVILDPVTTDELLANFGPVPIVYADPSSQAE